MLDSKKDSPWFVTHQTPIAYNYFVSVLTNAHEIIFGTISCFLEMVGVSRTSEGKLVTSLGYPKEYHFFAALFYDNATNYLSLWHNNFPRLTIGCYR